MIRIIAISDTHTLHKQISVPDGDVLIHAGDMMNRGQARELYSFNHWMGGLPHKHKVVIAGNHDWAFQRKATHAENLIKDSCTYLRDSSLRLDCREYFGGEEAYLNFWGSPWQPEFCGWAFNLPREGDQLAKVWAQIPMDTDILITHGPPYGRQDWVARTDADRVGCRALLERVEQVRPVAHVFGHIHEAYGVTEDNGIRYVNASTCDYRYKPINEPILILLDREGGNWVCRYCGPASGWAG